MNRIVGESDFTKCKYQFFTVIDRYFQSYYSYYYYKCLKTNSIMQLIIIQFYYFLRLVYLNDQVYMTI